MYTKIIYGFNEALLLHEECTFNQLAGELVLTSLNLIFCYEDKKLFKKSEFKTVIVPISNIKIVDNVPQLFYRQNMLEVFTKTGQIYQFYLKSDIAGFLMKLKYLITGVEEVIKLQEKDSNSLTKLKNNMFNFVGGVTSNLVDGVEKITKSVTEVVTDAGVVARSSVTEVTKKTGKAITSDAFKKATTGVAAHLKDAVVKDETVLQKVKDGNIVGAVTTIGLNAIVGGSSVTSQPKIENDDFEAQMKKIKKLKALRDERIITEEEFETKIKEIIGL